MADVKDLPKDWLLPSLIDHRAQTEPDTVWTEYPASPSTYDEGFKTVTYRKLANAVSGAARWIERTLGGKSDNFEVLAYMGPNDVRYMILIAAAVKAGYAMLLISPRNSLEAQLNLFKQTGCHKLVTTSPGPPAIQQLADASGFPVFHVPSVDELFEQDHVHYEYDKKYSENKAEPLVILHTSGSTGLPKKIVYTHEFAATYQRSFQSPPPKGYYSMNSLYSGNRLFFMLPPFHAAGVLMHLLNAVNNKTTIITPTSLTPPTARSLAEALKHVKIDCAFGTPLTCLEFNTEPALLDEVAANLETFFYAGGDCPKAIGDKINEKIKLFTIVGYTECGNFNQIRPIGPWSNEWKYIEIDPSMNAEYRHSHEDLYQHWIVRNPELEHKQAPFKLFPELQEYTSKDLFSRHPTKPNLWTHRGRADDIIVFLTGEKTNPISFEATIARDPDVSAALVVGAQRFQAALLVEPKEPLSTPSARAEFLERIWPLIVEANAACPAHARIARSHITFTIPEKPLLRAGKGTVQRAPSVTLYRDEITRLYADADKQTVGAAVPATAVVNASVGEITETVRENILKVTQWSSLDNEEDIFTKGVDSLQVLMLIRGIKATYQCEALAPSIIYTNRTVESLVRAIQKLDTVEQTSQAETATRFRNTIESSVVKHTNEVDLLRPSTSMTKSQTTERTVLLTGSTGAIGCYLLQELLANPCIKHIYCLNRSLSSATLQAERNQTHALPASWDTTRVTHLTADLSTLAFGLKEIQFQKLLGAVTDILHAAWPVNFNKPLDSFEPHLAGIVNLISFSLSASHSPQITFVSSISAAFGSAASGKTSTVPEIILTDPTAPGQTGYAASKHVAERILAHASEKLGVVSTILRVGQVAGPAESEGMWAPQEWLPSLVISSATLGALPDSFGAKSSVEGEVVDWVPIDLLAKVILDLAVGGPSLQLNGAMKSGSTPVKVYHPHNPQRTTWSALLPSVQKSMSAAMGRDIEVVSFASWIEKVKAASQSVLENTASKNGTGAQTVSAVPAVKLLDFYEGLLKSPATGKSVAPLETKLAECGSETLRKTGPITPQLMDKWVEGWMKLHNAEV